MKRWIRNLTRRVFPVTRWEAEECFHSAALALSDSLRVPVAMTIRVNTQKKPTLVEIFAIRERERLVIGSGTSVEEAAHFFLQNLRAHEKHD